MSNIDSKYHSSVFLFSECLSILSATGSKVYGDKFRLIEEDHELIFKLIVYFMRDEENAKKLQIDLGKGILLSGPIGCGKTALMNLFRFIVPGRRPYVMTSCRKVSFQFIQEGYSIIQKYSDCSFRKGKPELSPITHCFDDLGAENNLKYYGNDCNVMSEILLSRYEFYFDYGMISHITTNLNSSEIEQLYGNRLRSRLRETCNVLAFPSDTRDKRH
ncbi:ATPase [Reichenbachiella agariperforans]|nr:ATPase [Reichenbachiella agariperforans]